MKIAVVGCGGNGGVVAASMARDSRGIICIDKNKEIVDKIGRLGTNQQADQSEIDLSLKGQTKENETNKTVDSEFVFNVIDEVNTKKTATLSVEDTKFLMKRLEQLAKDAVEKKGTTGRIDSNQKKS